MDGKSIFEETRDRVMIWNDDTTHADSAVGTEERPTQTPSKTDHILL